MSRGLGWVQQGCLQVIDKYERKAGRGQLRLPTTFDIAAGVYDVKPDKHGNQWINDAQHVAVKRALEGLQRKSLIVGLRTQLARVPGYGPLSDGRTELCHHWMTEKGAQKYLQDPDNIDNGRADILKAKMAAIGMKAA